MEQLIEQCDTSIMTSTEYDEYIRYVSKLETIVASLLMAKDHDNKVIESLVRKNVALETQHDDDTRMWISNPLNATKEYKA